MLGAITGDIAGSRFEHHPLKSKNIDLFNDGYCRPTDDTVMTLAVCEALLECDGDWSRLEESATKHMQAYGRRYPHAGYGGRFKGWLWAEYPHAYFSFGNGSAMRVSPCAYAADTLDQALELSDKVTRVTHNHPEGMKGARAVTAAVWLALHGSTRMEIREHIDREYYPMDFFIDDIRPDYRFDVTCQGSVPQSIKAFLEAKDFEDAIRTSISLGGDADTMAAITGSIAEAYWGIPEGIVAQTLSFLNDDMRDTVSRFEYRFGIPAGRVTGDGSH